ncbi:MAG: hypothetical protein M3301_05670 [Chloroflexota bacterium]|nr:hypothetical protein [Chloroflexota bacterium]
MRRRRFGLLLICGAAVPLAVASTAWACGVLATLKLNTKVAAPNQTLTASGVNYSSSASASPVQIRLNSRDGAVLGEVPASQVGTGGRINATFQVPASANPGWYVVLATQTVNGVPKSGTPGRTTLRVQGASKRGAAVAPWSTSKPSGPGGSGATLAVDGGSGSPALWPTLLGVGFSLALLATGLTLVTRGRGKAANRAVLSA